MRGTADDAFYVHAYRASCHHGISSATTIDRHIHDQKDKSMRQRTDRSAQHQRHERGSASLSMGPHILGNIHTEASVAMVGVRYKSSWLKGR